MFLYIDSCISLFVSSTSMKRTSDTAVCTYKKPKGKRLCEEKDCQPCFDASFASHPQAVGWSISNTVSARSVPKYSHQKAEFACTKCNHTFQIVIYSVTKLNGSLCRYCSNRALCSDIDCTKCFNKSFASHPKASYWSQSNLQDARSCFLQSNKKAIFNCNRCNHTFEVVISSVSAGTWILCQQTIM
jgi:hypothetical protein